MVVEARSTEYVIAKTVKALLRIHHLNRDVIIGFIGERGGGKSVGAATAAMLDYGVEGDVLRSNMQITCDIDVSEELAANYEVEPGSVHYESEDLNKHKFLTFHPDYFRSVFVIDEINLWLADARRAMAQQNLLADDVAQQLRKWESPLFYTCIHEMFVDSRIRDMTDLFIKTADTALTEEGLRRKQRQGLSFAWLLYPMTKKFTGHTYAENHTAIGPIEVNGRILWDIIDTLERQERKKYKPEQEVEEPPVHIIEDKLVVNMRSEWGWLYDVLLQLHNAGITEMDSKALWNCCQLEARRVSKYNVAKQLIGMGIANHTGGGKTTYFIDTFDLKKEIKQDDIVEVSVGC